MGQQRVDAPCPHFTTCGGCSLQQMQESYYRDFKTKIVENALRQAGFGDVEVKTIFLLPASRRRAEFKLLKEKDKWQFAYMENRSHTKIAITNCLILEPELQKTLPLLQELVGALSFVDAIEAVSLTAADSGIDIVLQLSSSSKIMQRTVKLENEMKHIADMANIARISLTGQKSELLVTIENNALTMRLGSIDIPLPHDAFLQATSEGQRLLTDFVVLHTTNRKNILDLFCGIGTYSVSMAEWAKIHAVDDHKLMIANLKEAALANNISLTAELRNLFTKPLVASELKGFDSVVINPPRLGAKSQCEQIANSAVASVVMVSCNPATFVRDVKILKNAGFTLKDALAIDQFVWSPHLEIAASFIR